MSAQKSFSIIMPTYNSADTIRESLDSIANQDFDLKEIECLVIDGGSTDETIKIASGYPFVSILNNPKRLPEYAKLIGIQNAQGKYLIQMDSDESFRNNSTLSKRYNAISHFKESHIIIANKLDPAGEEIANKYVNYCGDPFSYFIYRQKDTILKTYKKNIIKDYNGAFLLHFREGQKRPIADGGTSTIDLDFIKELIKVDDFDITLASSMSDFVFDKTQCCVCIQDDVISHRSKSGFKTYLNKIRFRVINNVFSPAESGFSNRSISSKRKKFLFPLYVVSFVFPLIDSITLSLRCKSITMMLHIIYCYITLFLITYCYLLKAFNKSLSQKGY